jgi:anti-sigma factor RsiW
MSTHVYPFTEAKSGEGGDLCVDPAVGAMLPDYIVDLLEEPEAEEVDQHLIDCHHCKGKYLTILRIRYTARNSKTAFDDEDDRASNDANVRKLSDFK